MPKSKQEVVLVSDKYQILEKDLTDMFGHIAKAATKGCSKAFVLVSFWEANGQVIVSQNGPLPQKIDFGKEFDTFLQSQTELFEICDTVQNMNTSSNSVLRALNIRYFSGIPIMSETKEVLGCIYLLDKCSVPLSEEQKLVLELLAKDITSQLKFHKKNVELDKLKELHHLITENNPDLIFAKDSDLKILHANSAFLSLYPEEMRNNVIGYTTIEGFNEEEAEAFTAQDKLAFELGKTETLEKIVFPNGKTRTLFTTKTRFEDNEGAQYILGVARDVTEREELIKKLEKSNSDLDEFAYIASHDLKAPLNAVKRLVSWIEEDASEALQDDSLEHFGMIKSRIDRMNALLEDLLDYSRIGKDDGLPQQLNLKETVDNCFELLDLPENFVIDAEDTEFTLPKLPIELILTNLMSNAIKHHDKPSGTIKIQLKEFDNNYKLTVKDDGPGIDPSLHNKIFKKFQTLKPRDEVEGSGLGLAMIEKALLNYSGKISITSDVGKGATFTIIWPKP